MPPASPCMVPPHESAPSRVPLREERYELGELLGQGGFGKVYAAHDKVLGIPVALKMMNRRHARAPRAVESFAREALLGSRMLSPHVVKVLGLATTSDRTPCVVYERLVGETLAARIDRLGGLTLASTVEIVKQVALGLAHIHALGVVHRDIKPDNIFITETPEGSTVVKIIDFGVSETVNSSGSTSRDRAAGTPKYMAPEVLAGSQRGDVRSDLYALGVVAFECLTGRCPFEAPTLGGLITAMSGGDRPRLSDLRPDLPSVIDAWMERALHSDPYWRFASSKELVDELDLGLEHARKQRTILGRTA